MWDAGLDVWAWKATPRRHAVITSQLRPGARVWQARMDDRMLTGDQYFHLQTLDGIAQLTWVLANKDLEKSKRSKPPKPHPRPADMRANRDKAAREQARADRGLAWFKRAETMRDRMLTESGT